MGSEAVFARRIEKKFMLSRAQYDALLPLLGPYMVEDAYAHSCITNLYYDTPSFLLIRRSVLKPLYKEKLRVRSYGVPKKDGKVFVEIKKKFEGVVYKRRIQMTSGEATAYLAGEIQSPVPGQISREIDYFKQLYAGLAPAMYISYDRYSLASPGGGSVRITFDSNITWRENELSLEKGVYGNSLLPPDKILMEVKIPGAYPLWLVELFERLQIRQAPFSKYGTIFTEALRTGKIQITGGTQNGIHV